MTPKVTLTKGARCFLGNYSDRSVDPRVRGGKIMAAGSARNPNGTGGVSMQSTGADRPVGAMKAL